MNRGSTASWSLWTEEVDGEYHRIAIHEAACQQTIAMLDIIENELSSECYSLTKGLNWADITYLHNTKPLRFVDSDTTARALLPV